MHNETILKFGYPQSLIKEYPQWVVLLRPQQVTAGALILAAQGEPTSLSQLDRDTFCELSRVTRDIEKVLVKLFNYDKINYLALMMVDKHVHFHVIPRYASAREVCGIAFADSGWPKQPALSDVHELTDSQFSDLVELIKANWPG